MVIDRWHQPIYVENFYLGLNEIYKSSFKFQLSKETDVILLLFHFINTDD